MQGLKKALEAHLHDRSGIEACLSELEEARRGLEAHREDVLGVLRGTPDFLIAQERNRWLASLHKFADCLTEAITNIRDKSHLESLANRLPQLLESLSKNTLAVQEAAWSGRGPSSHAGVNELCHLLEEFLGRRSDKILDSIKLKCDIEFSRLEYQKQSYHQLPTFIAAAMEELLPEFQSLLQSLRQVGQLQESEADDLFAALEEWGAAYTSYDIDYLTARYADQPTELPAVNFAMNSQLLFLDGLVNEEMVDYAIDLGKETVQKAFQSFLEERELSLTNRDQLSETKEVLLVELQRLVELEDESQLKKGGENLIRLTERFLHLQVSAETEHGSRFNFKAE